MFSERTHLISFKIGTLFLTSLFVFLATGCNFSLSDQASKKGKGVQEGNAQNRGKGHNRDTQPPSIPSGLTAKAISTNGIDLSWSPSTDNVGVTGYYVYRNGANIGESPSASYQDRGLLPSTTYLYIVSAHDAAGNISVQSDPASATTLAPPDTLPPSVPSSFTATAKSSFQIDLSWAPSLDNVGVVAYEIYRNNGTAPVARTEGTTFQNTGLSPSTFYSYAVLAVDAAGNRSAKALASAVTLAPPDTQAPTLPTNLKASSVSLSQIDLSWTASTDNVGVVGYRIYRYGETQPFATTNVLQYSVNGLEAGKWYSFQIAAYDSAGNMSGKAIVGQTTQSIPKAPSFPMANAISKTQINLSWQDPANNELGFKIERAVSEAGPYAEINMLGANAISYEDKDLPGGAYYYRVRAYNAWGASPYSNVVSAVADILPPEVPGNLKAIGSSYREIYLTWDVPRDNVGVTGYRVYRDGALVGTIEYSSWNFFQDSGLATLSSHSYAVAAFDKVGNVSPVSPPILGTTLEDPLATAKVIIDDFTQVQYIESNAVNGDGQNTYTWNPEHTVVLSERMRDRGIEQKMVSESGLDPARLLGGGRLIQFNQTEQYSAVYLTIGHRYMSFGNDNPDPSPNADTVSLGYHGAIDRSQINEIVLSLHSIDSIGSNFILKVSDGVNSASLLYENIQRGFISREIVFPFSQMSGMSALAPTITSVELTMTSGGYGLDCGIQGLFAR